MLSVRDIAKRWLPTIVKDKLKEHLLPPPEEDVVLHDYQVLFEASERPRLSLVIPTVAANKAFGQSRPQWSCFSRSVSARGVDLRIILDNLEASKDTSSLRSVPAL